MKSFFTSSKLRVLRLPFVALAKWGVLAVHLLLLSPTHGILDQNANNLSDLWEKQYNNGKLFPNTFLTTADSDNDGWNNLTESYAGTDPFSATAPEGFVTTKLIPSLTYGAYTLEWPTKIGKVYQVQYSHNLTVWTKLGDKILADSTSHSIGVNATQPDTTVPPKLFWRVTITDIDSDIDRLTNAEENTLGLDPANAINIPGIPDLWLATHFLNELLTTGHLSLSAAADPDDDGLSNDLEFLSGSDPKNSDTDADGLSDSQDADPSDPLVIWQPSSASSYVLIAINELSDYYAYYINDKAEVLFDKKLWKSGQVIDLPEPSYTGPAREASETYDASHRGWRFMNNLGRYAGIGDSSFPEPYIEDLDQETIFVHDANAQQANFDFTKNIPMWNFGNLTLNPIGITDAGEVVTGFQYRTYGDPEEAHETIENKLAIFDSATTSYSFLPLPSGYENGNIFGNHFASSHVTPSGWISTLIKATSQASGAAYRLALWNPSKQLVALPEQASCEFDKISLTELPNQKIGIIAGQGVNLESKVFLPNSAGAMQHNTKLSGKNLHVFAGDGTALSSDGMMWRNGKIVPMQDICEQWSNYEADYTFHPVKGNKHGIYLIQAKKIDTENQLLTNKHLIAVPVDLDFIKPGTENQIPSDEIAEDKEDLEGEVVNINWDDDSEGDGGHGKLVFKNDFDDTTGNEEENDMIRLKLHRPDVDQLKARLKYDNTYVKIWQNPDRTGEVISEVTEFEMLTSTIVYLEGRKITAAETPQIVEMQVKVAGSSAYVAGDKVSVHVAKPVIYLGAKLMESVGYEAVNLAEQLKKTEFLGKNRRDNRNNTVILKGKDQSGKALWYSIDIFDLYIKTVGNKSKDKPEISIREIHLDKEMKMALSLLGAHVICSGHSNYGLGPNFTPNNTSTKTIDDYCNLTGGPAELGGITAIILKTNDPVDALFDGNPMKSPYHGGSEFAIRPEDIVQTVNNYKVTLPDVLKFNGKKINGDTLAVGTVLTPQASLADGTIYHYKQDDDHQHYVTVVKSTGDVPVLRYNSCFMALCNSGRAYSQSLTHGVLFYTRSECYGVIGGKTGKIAKDHYTDEVSWTSTHYIRLLTEGKGWDEIKSWLNTNQYIPENLNAPETPTLYNHTPLNN
jgi:hypothetical protein